MVWVNVDYQSILKFPSAENSRRIDNRNHSLVIKSRVTVSIGEINHSTKFDGIDYLVHGKLIKRLVEYKHGTKNQVNKISSCRNLQLVRVSWEFFWLEQNSDEFNQIFYQMDYDDERYRNDRRTKWGPSKDESPPRNFDSSVNGSPVLRLRL